MNITKKQVYKAVDELLAAVLVGTLKSFELEEKRKLSEKKMSEITAGEYNRLKELNEKYA